MSHCAQCQPCICAFKVPPKPTKHAAVQSCSHCYRLYCLLLKATLALAQELIRSCAATALAICFLVTQPWLATLHHRHCNAAQVVEVVEEASKHKWLTDRLQGFIDQGDVLVFAGQKARVDELTDKLKAGGFRWALG